MYLYVLLVLNKVYTLCMFLQNNVAEVRELHSKLMWKDFIDTIGELLCSTEIEVSYFSAGIIAHLISRGEQAWTLSPTQRKSLMEQLVC